MVTNKMSSSLSFNIPKALPSLPQSKFHPLSIPFNRKQSHISNQHNSSVSLFIALTANITSQNFAKRIDPLVTETFDRSSKEERWWVRFDQTELSNTSGSTFEYGC
ncbi:hypothetical protein R6Q59_012144 [Mikania micrantha]